MFFVRKGRVVGRKGFVLDKVEELTPGGLVDRILEALYGDEPPTGMPKQVLVPCRAGRPSRRTRSGSASCAARGCRSACRSAATSGPCSRPSRGTPGRSSPATGCAAPAITTRRSRALTELQDLLDLPRRRCASSATTWRTCRAPTTSGRWWCSRTGCPNKREYRQFKVKRRARQRRLRGDGGGAHPSAHRLPRRTRPSDRRARASRRRASSPIHRSCLLVDGGKGQLGVAKRVVDDTRAGRRDPGRRPRQAVRGGLRAGPVGSGRDPAGERSAVHAAADPRRGPPVRQHVPRRAPRRSG